MGHRQQDVDFYRNEALVIGRVLRSNRGVAPSDLASAVI
ncbi:hypothetical protein [Azospirillum palustre]